MLEALAGYLTLFVTAFAAASLLPFYSEPLLGAMLLLEPYTPVGLWLSASAGNTLGAVLNWWLGRFITRWQDRRWFPVSPRQLERATDFFRRYGTWTLLLAWAPVGGDALTFVAGTLRVRLPVFVLLVGIGKSARYAVLIWAVEAAIA